MNNSSFPTLLNRKAKIIAGMNRIDLMVMGGGYLILSWLKVSGIPGLIIIVSILFIFKLATKHLPKGFMKEINAPKKIKWSYKLEDFHG